jgi:hypothetical protein
VLCVSLQITFQVRCRTENQSFDERQLAFLLKGFLFLEQRPQLLGLEVGQDQWIVDRREPAVCFPGPGSGITEQSTKSNKGVRTL